MIKYPNYDESILSVASSVLNYFGVKDCAHKTLKEFDALLDKNYENIIVMLFDGMGVDAINNHLNENDFLRTHFVKPISSVFPPTTVAATTTIESGYSPFEHAWLGWDLYFKELNENVSVFTNKLQKNGESVASYHVAGKYAPHDNIFNRIEKENKHSKAYYVSRFSKLTALMTLVILLKHFQRKEAENTYTHIGISLMKRCIFMALTRRKQKMRLKK